MPRSRALPPAMLLAALAAAPAHAALPSVTVQDAHVVEGDAGTSSLRFEVVAIGTPRRLALNYSLSDLTASAASGDYASAGGVVSLAPEPARLIEQWGERNFTIPTGIAQAPNGDLLAVDGPSSRLNRFSSAGVLLQTTKVESPEGVAVSSASEVFVLSFHGRVRVFNSTGKLLRSFGDTTQVGSDIAVDAAGSVYVSEVVSNRIQKYSSSGSAIGGWSTATPGEPANDGPLGIAVDAQGFVYVAKAQSGRILKFAANGSLVATWTDTKGFCPGSDLYVDDAGNLLVADLHTARVVVLDPQGAFLTEWTLDDGPMQNPTEFGATGIVSDHDGNVYVTTRHSGTIEHFRWDRSSGTIVVPVTGDQAYEPDETMQLQLAPTPSATLVDATAVGTILNDDPQLGPNLATNGQFESGYVGWGASGSATLQLSLDGIGGSNAMSVNSTSALSFGLNDAPNIVSSTTSPARFRYSASVKSAVAGSASLKVREYVGGVLQSTATTTPVAFDGSWQRLSVLVNAHSAGASLDFQVMGAFTTTGRSFLVDDVAVQALGADVPPVVDAPSDASGSWGREIAVDVSAHDPEGDTLATLGADLTGLPGATFTVAADRTHGTLRWTPGFAAVRNEPYAVTFTAHNALSGSATTRIHVGPNLVLNPSFETDLSGWTGHIGATLARMPGGRRDGYAAHLTLPTTTWAGLSDTPNWGASSGQGRLAVFGAWVRSDADQDAVRMQVREYQSGVLLATTTSVDGPLYSNQLTPAWHRIMVVHHCVGNGDLDLTIDAPGVSGATFDVDDVSIVNGDAIWTLDVPKTNPVATAARVLPNPARGQAVLELSLPAAGPLRIELYDLAGRRRAVIADEAHAAAGAARYALRASDGPLAPGVYWYRASTTGATVLGRFVVVE